MNNKLQQLAYGIMCAEGYYPPGVDKAYPNGTLSFVNHNPGNLRSSPLESGNSGNFAVFANLSEGFFALQYLLWNIAKGYLSAYPNEQTIGSMLIVYTALDAASAEYTNYLEVVCTKSGLTATQLLSELV